MRMRKEARLLAAAAAMAVVALIVPTLASANHISYPVTAVGGAVVGNSGTNVVACTASANIAATPNTGNLLSGKVHATATSRCNGTQGLLRAFLQVWIYQGSILLHYQECRFFTGIYPANKTYSCPTPNIPFSGIGVFRAETNQAYRLPSGSWVLGVPPGDCFISTYPDQGLPAKTGARCEVEVVTAG